MNESKIAEKIVTASAGPLTLLEQVRDDLNRGKLEDDRWLKIVGQGWGHTRGADYVFGDAGRAIAYALVGYSLGHNDKESTLAIVRRNIQQALRDNEPFRGLRGEERATHELWVQMMKGGRAASVTAASIEEGDICTVDMREAQRLLGSDVPGTHHMKIIRDVVRQGGGKVVIEEVRGDTAQVSAHDNPMSRIMGMVDVPLRALKKTASITAASDDSQETVAQELVAIARELVAAETFECPNCGTKVLESTGYCVKCKEKVKKAANKQRYRGYTIEKSGMNFYVTDPSGHRAFGEVPASVETAKKWIDMDIREKGGMRKAQWENLPKGWTRESLKSFYGSLAGGGDAKKKFYSCVEKIKGTDITNPESFCGSLMDAVRGDTSWRSVGR